jgi:hypothetical protein
LLLSTNEEKPRKQLKKENHKRSHGRNWTDYSVDQELSRFIAAGKLHCKIDKVAGVLETNRPDAKNALSTLPVKFAVAGAHGLTTVVYTLSKS